MVGASEDATRIGGRTVANLLRGRYAGPIFPINPKHETVQGLPAWPSIAEVPHAIDTVVIAVPENHVIPAVQEAAAKGARGAVIFSAGFNEAGPDGEARQRALDRISQESGLRIIGPNCLGVYNARNGAWLSFTTQFQETVDGPTIGLVSQSGGSAAHILKLAQQRGLTIGTFFTTGNEADVEFGEAMHALVADPATKVIVAYIEGIRNGASVLAALEAARRARKPVITLKVGRTQAGALAAASHTASLAGEDRVYDAIFRAYGVHRAGSTEELLDVAQAALHSTGNFPKGGRLGVATISGGMGAQIADAAADAGLTTPAIDMASQALLKALCPPGSPRNPVDITAQLSTDPDLLGQSLRIMAGSNAFDMLFAFFGVYADVPGLSDKIRESLVAFRADYPDIAVGLGIICGEQDAKRYAEGGFLVFEEPARAVKAMAALARFESCFGKTGTVDATTRVPRLADNRSFNEAEAKDVLRSVGIAIPEEKIARDPTEAASLAGTMKLPLALKIVSPDILHKSDVGGVRLGLTSPQDVLEAAGTMLEAVGRALPEAGIDGLLLSEMVPPGVELILGTRRDAAFGPIVMIGLGGVTTELFEDVAIRPAPVTLDEAHVMLRELKSYPLLDGYRGDAPSDVDSAARAIVAVAALAVANPRVETLEINPLRILPVGCGAIALDAVIELRSQGTLS
ncbi:hypothetical protein L284_12945 [Novosphingobium lindaniclasticum LE124]|uniref:CoA-binding domain-containing protein n=1 Tax=Novosphingobium lindaniclasticum LE124 TaxID=1096930 RepID=T0HDA2_9SPHN|nr:hypothetical protein L284_12945 [Novosphingobium lindaniclasticum LE124]